MNQRITSQKKPTANHPRRREWRPLALVWLAIAVVMASSQANAWDEALPIIGSIAEDLIEIGDRQNGKSEFIRATDYDRHSPKVRHQQVTLDGATFFCTQYPTRTQVRILGFAKTIFNENLTDTICNPTQDSTQSQIHTEDAEVLGDSPDWLQSMNLKTERSYCIGNYEAREFFNPPPANSWLSEGAEVPYQEDMFVGFDVFADRETGAVFAVSSELDYDSAREMGCSLYRSKIVVKLNAYQAQ